MKPIARHVVVAVFSVLVIASAVAHAAQSPAGLTFACSAENDLYRVLTSDGANCPRFDEPAEAIGSAPAGSGVLILADGYPQRTADVAAADFRLAAEKKLRLYVEYPARLPGLELRSPRRVHLERAVVATGAFEPFGLKPLRILAIHDCHFVPVTVAGGDLVAARVAGFDRAVYGLDDVETHPLLFEHPDGGILVCTTKLSQFVTARYATKDAIQAVWQRVFRWLRPGGQAPKLEWEPVVRPTHARSDPLPPDTQRRAIVRGIDWHTRARMLVHPSWKGKYTEYREQGTVQGHNPVGPPPDPEWPAGDGSCGVLEGVASQIRYDGTQPVRWWLRSDSNGETALAFALRSRLDGDQRSRRVGENLLDWVYFKSGLFQNDPQEADFGLVRWSFDNGSLYGDNDVKIILSCLGTGALLKTDRWDEVLVQNILGNFRTTGRRGFRLPAVSNDELLRLGWQHYWRSNTVHYAPHYQAWIWATYLWLYDKTRYEPQLERTRRAIGEMMAAYPDRWRWTNGIQQERGRMLLTLAWLIRVDDRPQHRAWLKRIADDMRRCQVPCGAIREELGEIGHGSYRPPTSNAEYGTREASLIQENGDPVADLLYTCNFAFLGLHEAYAATGEPQYREMADRLADFLVRVQVRSHQHPELDGGWFRAFDYNRWDYWGSNADAGWGAWSIEVGWTQAWIPTVLALRELDLNLWDLSKTSRVGEHFEKCRGQMLGDEPLETLKPKEVRHAAVGKAVRLAVQADRRYPGAGAPGLCDGLLGFADHTSPEWLGFQGEDLDATVDLETPQEIHTLAANFLQSTRVGIFLPKQVEFAVSADGRRFEVVATVKPAPAPDKPGPLTATLEAKDLKARGRYVRVRAANFGTLPPSVGAGAVPAWLFVDEILINP